MASRYWVGGSGLWTDTTHWSTTSGGASGAAMPTSTDDVYIDNNSTTLTTTYIGVTTTARTIAALNVTMSVSGRNIYVQDGTTSSTGGTLTTTGNVTLLVTSGFFVSNLQNFYIGGTGTTFNQNVPITGGGNVSIYSMTISGTVNIASGVQCNNFYIGAAGVATVTNDCWILMLRMETSGGKFYCNGKTIYFGQNNLYFLGTGTTFDATNSTIILGSNLGGGGMPGWGDTVAYTGTIVYSNTSFIIYARYTISAGTPTHHLAGKTLANLTLIRDGVSNPGLVQFDAGTITVTNLKVQGLASGSPLTVQSAGSTTIAIATGGSSFGQWATMNVTGTTSESLPLYIGATSTQMTSGGWTIADPKKIENLIDPFLVTPSTSQPFRFSPTTTGTNPTLIATGPGGGGYKFANAVGKQSGILSNDSFDLLDSSVIINIPEAMNEPGPQSYVNFNVGLINLSYDTTSGGYKTAWTTLNHTVTAALWPADLSSVGYIRISLKGTTITFENSTDGVLWNAETATPISFTVNPLDYRSCRVSYSEYTGSLATGTTSTIGGINVIPSNVGSYYVDGHSGVLDTAGVWTNDSSAFDNNDSTYASTLGYSGDVFTRSLQGIGTNAPTSGGVISGVYARAKYNLPDGSLGENIHTYTDNVTMAGDSGNLSGATGTTGSTGVYVGGWLTLPAPSGGWTWASVNGLAARAWATGSSSNELDVRSIEVKVATTLTAPDNSAFFAFFYP